MGDLIDHIYEAAFVPELWPSVLAEIAVYCDARSGAVLIIDERLPPLFSATPNNVDVLAQIAQTPFWYQNPPARRLRKLNYPGFLESSGFLAEDERGPDNTHVASMSKIGADWQAGSVVDMPDGEMVLFTFERASGLPDFSKADLGRLDELRPHLARAGLLAAKLKLEQARSSVNAMAAIGIPAAIVSGQDKVIAANADFERLSDVLRPAAFGRLSARDRNADLLLQSALPMAGEVLWPQVRSIPMPSLDGSGGLVVHVMPLQRSASDLFDRGAAMVAVTGYAANANIPADVVLKGLFDLSAAEAGVARALAAGHGLKEIAAERGVSMATVRTHLAQVFRKTGTGQQGQLVALLKGSSIGLG